MPIFGSFQRFLPPGGQVIPMIFAWLNQAHQVESDIQLLRYWGLSTKI